MHGTNYCGITATYIQGDHVCYCQILTIMKQYPQPWVQFPPSGPVIVYVTAVLVTPIFIMEQYPCSISTESNSAD